MRLDRYVAHALGITRTGAQNRIKNREIMVNDQICPKHDRSIDDQRDHVLYQGKELIYQEYYYLMLNKPQGYISATKDHRDATIIDLVDVPFELAPIGRLDKDTEGLVLLTNHGELIHHLTAPRSHVTKTYYVKTREPLDDGYIDAFQQGFNLYDGKKKLYHSKPSKIELLSSHEALVHLEEGKYHQVKKMFFAMKNEVIYLKRVAIGPIKLDPTLALGAYRFLLPDEVATLLSYLKGDIR
jgi:16S rRNA pseudouridine516 synthase